MGYRGNPGINKLANVISGRVKRENESSGETINDLGTIKDNGHLLTDSFPVEISKNDYMVAKHIKDLSPGDRVIVMWVSDIPVIAGILDV